MRILIYGAGVIGSLYATLFADAGHTYTVFHQPEAYKILLLH